MVVVDREKDLLPILAQDVGLEEIPSENQLLRRVLMDGEPPRGQPADRKTRKQADIDQPGIVPSISATYLNAPFR